ncbi:MAG: hypothetical protein BWY71_01480 [Planctomycetes bacterium ADurb.Bin412]|nr:MAG: hypothetical protein BWY71_01480 [Planctomycetes bacterium ADurb.Bin412]
MPHRLQNGVVADPHLCIQILLDIRRRHTCVHIPADVFIIGSVIHRVEALIAQLPVAFIDLIGKFIQISFRHSMKVQKRRVKVLPAQIKTPEIPLVLSVQRDRRFLRSCNYPKVEPPSLGRRQARLIPQPHIKDLINGIFPLQAVAEHLSGDQMLPFGGKLTAVNIAGLKIVASMEAKLHRSFAAAAVIIAAVASAEPIGGMIVHPAVINKAPLPVIDLAGLLKIIIRVALVNLIRRIISIALVDILRSSNKDINRNGSHNLRTIHMSRPLRMYRMSAGRIGGHSIINKAGKVQRTVICVWNPDGAISCILRLNPVSNQSAIVLGCNDRRIDVVSGRFIASDSVVMHGQVDPVGRIFKVRIKRLLLMRIGNQRRDGNRQIGRQVGPRRNYLVFEDDRLHTVGVGHFGGDFDRLAGKRLGGLMVHLTNLRRGIFGKDAVLIPRGRRPKGRRRASAVIAIS